jgi:hypothetical protein
MTCGVLNESVVYTSWLSNASLPLLPCLRSAYPAYQLKQADVTCGSLNELAVYNLRRLFAQQVQYASTPRFCFVW